MHDKERVMYYNIYELDIPMKVWDNVSTKLVEIRNCGWKYLYDYTNYLFAPKLSYNMMIDSFTINRPIKTVRDAVKKAGDLFSMNTDYTTLVSEESCQISVVTVTMLIRRGSS